jgi:hypothetical protein
MSLFSVTYLIYSRWGKNHHYCTQYLQNIQQCRLVIQNKTISLAYIWNIIGLYMQCMYKCDDFNLQTESMLEKVKTIKVM